MPTERVEFVIYFFYGALFLQQLKQRMDSHQKHLREFEEFAKSRFVDHSEELRTTYQNARVHPHDLRLAYLAHQQILEIELQDKIDELLKGENVSLRTMLNGIKDRYLEKLKKESNQLR
jgi:AAA+ ATPase superfamily predicted ATPase